MHRALAGTLALAALVVTPPALAQEPVPEGSYPPPSVRWKLVTAGVAVTGLAWGASYLSASTWPEVPGSGALKVPVAGPWIALAQNGCAADDPDCGAILYLRGILLVIDGLVQAGGVGIIAEGVLTKTEPRRPPPKRSAIVVRPAPVVTSHATGMGVVGAF